jgi:myosin-5
VDVLVSFFSSLFLFVIQFFAKPRFSNVAFIIKHYAQDVCYECEGFLDKNRDTVSDELEEVLLATKDSLLATIFGGSGTKKTDLQKIQAGLNTIKKGLQQMSPQQPASHKISKPTLGFVFKVRSGFYHLFKNGINNF